ncbi:MAG: hypothetical protein C4304_01420 [candidate division GAL15 bacterium]
MRRFLSYEEATAQLPVVREAVLELRQLRERLRAVRAALQAEPGLSRASLEQDPQGILHSMSEVVRRIEQAGGQFKDLDLGLVDFLTLRGGQPVYYCWRLGEPQIQYWHGLEEGFAGRKPHRSGRLDRRALSPERTGWSSWPRDPAVSPGAGPAGVVRGKICPARPGGHDAGDLRPRGDWSGPGRLRGGHPRRAAGHAHRRRGTGQAGGHVPALRLHPHQGPAARGRGGGAGA